MYLTEVKLKLLTKNIIMDEILVVEDILEEVLVVKDVLDEILVGKYVTLTAPIDNTWQFLVVVVE